MADGPLEGFISVLEAERRIDQQPYNVIGICTDYLEPAQSRGSDLTMRFQLWDNSCQESQHLSPDGMLVRCFSKEKHGFPHIEEVGDVVVIHRLKTNVLGSRRFCLSSFATTWSVISGHSLLDSHDPEFRDVIVREPYEKKGANSRGPPERPSLPEFRYAKALVAAKDFSKLRGPPKSTAMDVATIMSANGGTPAPYRQKYCLIQDLRSPYGGSHLQFVDLVGEVRKVWPGRGNPVELQLTDFTEHPLLFNHPEEDETAAQWIGPWGQRVITINAWDQHGVYVMEKVQKGEIERGTYVRVNNCQIKMDRSGALMQGNLRGGNNSGTSVIIYNVKDAERVPELKELISRKRDYNVDRKSKAIGFDREPMSRKRSADIEQEKTEEPKAKKSKNAKKRETARLKKAKVNGGGSEENTPVSKVNQHVRCEAVNIPPTTISSILQTDTLDRTTPTGNQYHLPFKNCKYKSKVQVIDFFPDTLEDFAIPYQISDYEALDDYDSADDDEASIEYARRHPDNVRWKWHFLLMVEDPQISKTRSNERATMLLQVAGQDGDYLLNMEACNLRDKPRELAKLKEKMFVLWGDLEEKKTEHVKSGLELAEEGITISSKPFECLIKEYGVQARTENGEPTAANWERMFAIFGTNVG